MASGEDSELEDAPAALYSSAVWDHFACRVTYESGKKVVDKSATVCKYCATRITETHLTCWLICGDIPV